MAGKEYFRMVATVDGIIQKKSHMVIQTCCEHHVVIGNVVKMRRMLEAQATLVVQMQCKVDAADKNTGGIGA